MTSTILGASGSQYVQGETLHKNENGSPTIFKATRGNEAVVFKQESKSIFDLSRRLADEFTGSRRLRMPIDFNAQDRIVVYPYFRDTLLGLMRADPDFPPTELKKILRCVGEAIQEFHAKDWLHLDVKPDNIFVNWTCDEDGNKTVTDAVLGDFGIAYKQVGATPLRTGVALGNFMWRSPEGQTGSGMTKASDVFSYGLVCIYALGGGDLLLLEDKKVLAELAVLGIAPYEDILTRHFTYFGLVNDGLLKLVDSCKHNTLRKASAIAEVAVRNQPELRFEVWGKELGEAALEMISGMTRPDPAARLTIDQVLGCSWWQEH
ncbi:kinase-like domain-containing protein [Thermothelomyces heterothallicus CBS 202.75]|uniref:kinase-like domain-containing protein n=1 Tax=Thermothelomyces heterothallicus CBS 202.75 TaxID=1149848 RepID=UPI0037425807